VQRIALFLFIGLLACETSDGPKPNLDKEYFPLQVGNFQIFHVEGVEYVLRQPYPFEYELKSIVSDSFHVGDIVRYVIHRSKREPGASTWEYFETFSAEVNSREVVEYDGNTAFLRIKLPLFDSTRWEANIYNTWERKNISCRILEIRLIRFRTVLLLAMTMTTDLSC